PALLGASLLFQPGFPGAQLLALFDVVARAHACGDIAQGVLEALARGRVPDLVVRARAMLTSRRGSRWLRRGRRLADRRRIVRTHPTGVWLVRSGVGRTRPVGISGDAADRTTVDEHQGERAARSHFTSHP